jgi:hypothetical protein
MSQNEDVCRTGMLVFLGKCMMCSSLRCGSGREGSMSDSRHREDVLSQEMLRFILASFNTGSSNTVKTAVEQAEQF